MLPRIEKLTEAKETFSNSEIQFNIGAAHILHKHTLRRGMNRQVFKYLLLRKKGVLYLDHLLKRN